MNALMHLAGYGTTALISFVAGAFISATGTDTTSVAAPRPSTTTATSTTTVTDPGSTTTTTAAPETSTTTKTATVTAEPPAPASAIPGDGTFEVGVDVEPGTYVAGPGSRGQCYWARLSGSGDLGDIIDNNISSGQSIVTIAASDKFFESSGCSDWTKR